MRSEARRRRRGASLPAEDPSNPGGSGRLRIHLFGSVRAAHDFGARALELTPSVQALLAYLLLRRDASTPRDVLAGVFWGDVPERRARSCLNTTLWRLRRALEPDGTPRGTYLVCTPGRAVYFNRDSDHWLDVAEFEAAARVTRIPYDSVLPRDVENLDRVLGEHSADLLEGFYEDWALGERDRIHARYLDSLAWLMAYWDDDGSLQRAIDCGQRYLARDPLRESVHRGLMKLFMTAGRPAAAIQQYETCRRVLDAELGIQPTAETTEFYRMIRTGGAVPAGHGDKDGDAVTAALRELEQLLATFDEARERIVKVIPMIRETQAGSSGASDESGRQAG